MTHRRMRPLFHGSVLAGVVGLAVTAAPFSSSQATAAPAKADDAEKAKKKKGKRAGRRGGRKSRKGRGGALDIELDVQQFTLDNGLRVLVVEDHSTPAFAMHLGYKVGSRDEVEGRSGFAHLFEHMMFKGSENVPEGGHIKYVLGVGGQMNAGTSADATQYFNVLPSHYLDMALWLESDRLRSLAVTDENFENQRAAVKEEKAMRVDNAPYFSAMMDFMSEVWSGTGYGHPTIGSLEDLNAAETQDVQSFFDKWYVPNNAVMGIVGDVEFEEVKAKVKEYFGDIPQGPERPEFPEIDHTQDEPLEKKAKDPLARQPLYLIGWKTVPKDHEDARAIDLLMNLLLRGDSSRITRILKDEKELVVQSLPIGGFGGGHDAGMAAAAFIPVEGASFDEIKTVVKTEIAKVKKRGISRKDLQKAINQVTVDTVGSLATNNGRAGSIVQGELFFDDPTHVLTELDQYRAVTRKDIKRVANQYLTENWLVLEIVPEG